MKSIDELVPPIDNSTNIDNNVSSDMVDKMTNAITTALKESSASNKVIADNFLSAIEKKTESTLEVENKESEVNINE